LNYRDFSRLSITRESTKRSLEILLRLKQDFGLNVDILRCYPLCLIGDLARFDKFSKHNCAAGVTTCTIGPEGGIRPCSYSDEVYGNVLRESLSEGWQRMTKWRDGSLIPQTCKDCEYLRQCTAGCRMGAKYYDDITSKDPLATNPEDVIAPTREPVTIFDASEFVNKRLIVNPNLRSRKEKFGGILVAEGYAPVFINNDTFKLLFSLGSLSKES